MKPKIALVVPHIFMHRDLLPQVIFSPGRLAISLADGLTDLGHEVTLYSPGLVNTKAHNITADLSLFQKELNTRGDTYLELLKKHPFTFITLARQVQSEVIARAYADANAGKVDIVHIYSNEEETALPFAQLCSKPVVFTHHDPYNFMVKYKNVFPKYRHLNWVSFSMAQRAGMPQDTNWVGNVYHGLPDPCERLDLSHGCERSNLSHGSSPKEQQTYFAYLGRIIEPKGVHLAIAAVRAYNRTAAKPLPLKIAGKHYSSSEKKSYWDTRIAPELDEQITYEGFIDSPEAKRDFLSTAAALIVPSVFDEPFGMVAIEAMACGTPVIALDSGALPEVIENGKTGFVANKTFTTMPSVAPVEAGTQQSNILDETKTVANLQMALQKWPEIDRQTCRTTYETRFTASSMCEHYADVYATLCNN